MLRFTRRSVERLRATAARWARLFQHVLLVLAQTAVAQSVSADHEPGHDHLAQAPDVIGLNPIEALRQLGLDLVGDDSGGFLPLERAFDLSISAAPDGVEVARLIRSHARRSHRKPDGKGTIDRCTFDTLMRATRLMSANQFFLGKSRAKKS